MLGIVLDEFKVTNVGATSWNDPGESFGIMCILDLTALWFKMDLFTWLNWVVWNNLLDHHLHCGYKFPWNPLNLIIDPPVHDYHVSLKSGDDRRRSSRSLKLTSLRLFSASSIQHYQNNGNFATSHWDMLFGTNKKWLQWQKRQEERKARGLEEEAENRED